VVKKGLAKALERRMGQDEGLISQIETKSVDSSLLMNPTRLSIFQLICNNPGAHLRLISRKLGFSTQTASWHLKKLVAKGLISKNRFANKNHYYPLKDILGEEQQRVLGLFYDENIKRTYLHLKDNPHVDQRHLCEALNIYQQLLSKALIAMQRYDLIAYQTENKTRYYRITDKLDKLGEQFTGPSSDFSDMLVEALTMDGVDPRIISDKGSILKIELDSGGKRRSVLKIQKDPVKAVLRI
jgi:DNA-binding MarR family transcriptional regulator